MPRHRGSILTVLVLAAVLGAALPALAAGSPPPGRLALPALAAGSPRRAAWR